MTNSLFICARPQANFPSTQMKPRALSYRLRPGSGSGKKLPRVRIEPPRATNANSSPASLILRQLLECGDFSPLSDAINDRGLIAPGRDNRKRQITAALQNASA